jgi:hypothetical protein
VYEGIEHLIRSKYSTRLEVIYKVLSMVGLKQTLIRQKKVMSRPVYMRDMGLSLSLI